MTDNKNIIKMMVSLDKSLLYNVGTSLGSSERTARGMAESGQEIELTVIVNPFTGEIHVIAINGVATSKAVKI